jgi:hypothetical protein
MFDIHLLKKYNIIDRQQQSKGTQQRTLKDLYLGKISNYFSDIIINDLKLNYLLIKFLPTIVVALKANKSVVDGNIF